MKLLLRAFEHFLKGFEHEDWGEVAEGIWILDDYVREHNNEFTPDELNEYFRLFDEFLDWENWYYEKEVK